jgi:hypothetical protein
MFVHFTLPPDDMGQPTGGTSWVKQATAWCLAETFPSSAGNVTHEHLMQLPTLNKTTEWKELKHYQVCIRVFRMKKQPPRNQLQRTIVKGAMFPECLV